MCVGRVREEWREERRKGRGGGRGGEGRGGRGGERRQEGGRREHSAVEMQTRRGGHMTANR